MKVYRKLRLSVMSVILLVLIFNVGCNNKKNPSSDNNNPVSVLPTDLNTAKEERYYITGELMEINEDNNSILVETSLWCQAPLQFRHNSKESSAMTVLFFCPEILFQLP